MLKMFGEAEMADGTIHDGIRITSKDMIRYSDTAVRHKWGSMEDDPIRFGTFVVYAAMTRTGRYPHERGFDDFLDDVVMANIVDVEEGLHPTS